MELFTVGYQDKTLQELLSLLEKEGISTLVDVRANPFSRKKGFSKKDLEKALFSEGIGYLHLKELGAPPSLRQQVQKDGDYGGFFAEYRRYLQHKLPPLEQVLSRLEEGRCCLFCLESDSAFCHRRAVAEKIVELKPEVKVVHL